MAYEVESEVELDYYYRLCDQRIPCLQGCLGELHWSIAAMSS